MFQKRKDLAIGSQAQLDFQLGRFRDYNEEFPPADAEEYRIVHARTKVRE